MKIKTAISTVLFSTALMFGQSAARKDAVTTAVTGESWLHHLNRSFDETSMGKTWRLGPAGPATDESGPPMQWSIRMLSGPTASGARMETLQGSDLYRLNCQGCHGQYGHGAPPEIASLIDPVRATSFALVTRRMKTTGMALTRRETAELVNQSRGALLKRLHEGGKDMPSFHHLSETEVRSLVAYLNQLAGVPGAEKKQVAIQESHARVGELVVKSTCHVCHDATGLNPSRAQLFDGVIPPLSALPARVNQAQLVRKVTSGAPVIMGTTSSVYRSRMPVFNYLSENEAVDVYAYLTRYPPAELASLNQVHQADQPDPSDIPNYASEALAAGLQTAPVRVSGPREPVSAWVLPVVMGWFAAALLVLGCWITAHEFKRLSEASLAREASRILGRPPAPWVTPYPRAGLPMKYARRATDSAGRVPSVMQERKIS